MYYIFTDGSSSKKVGSIGSSYIIYNENKEKIFSYGFGFKDPQGRNGIAELLGVYGALYKIIQHEDFDNEEVIIYSDSQYVVYELTIWFRNQMAKNFYDTKNKEVIIYLLYLLAIIREQKKCVVKFEWIRGHQTGNSFEVLGNNEADKRAVESRFNTEKLKYIDSFVEKIKNIVKEEDALNYIKKYYQ